MLYKSESYVKINFIATIAIILISLLGIFKVMQ